MPAVSKTFDKLSKKDPVQFNALSKKIEQILSNPFAFKPLHAPMQNKRRVHILKSFVLIYSINEKEKKIIIEDYCHHDLVYK